MISGDIMGGETNDFGAKRSLTLDHSGSNPECMVPTETKESQDVALKAELSAAKENLSPFVKNSLNRYPDNTSLKTLVDAAESCYEFNHDKLRWQIDPTAKRFGDAYRAEKQFLENNPPFDRDKMLSPVTQESGLVASLRSGFEMISGAWHQFTNGSRPIDEKLAATTLKAAAALDLAGELKGHDAHLDRKLICQIDSLALWEQRQKSSTSGAIFGAVSSVVTFKSVHQTSCS